MKRKIIILVLIGALFLPGAGLVATVSNYNIKVNGQNLNATVLNSGGSTYLPTRALAESLGADVSFSGNTVNISTVDLDRLKEACVMIKAANSESIMQGSGTYIDYDQVLTANHIAENRTEIKASDGTTLTVENSDSKTDAVILESSSSTKPVKIGDSDEIKLGDTVIVVASPKAKEDTVVYAKVIDFDPQGIVIKATLGSGASGGAVFDINGCLIGIVIAADGTTDAVETKQLISPINDIREAL